MSWKQVIKLLLLGLLPVVLFIMLHRAELFIHQDVFEWQDLSEPDYATFPPCDAENKGRVYQCPDSGHYYACVGQRGRTTKPKE